MDRFFQLFTSLLAVCLLVSCATRHNHPRDPYEKYNRAVFGMNHELDRFILRPVADMYHTLMPPPVETGVSNMFNNVYEPSRMANDLLQLNFPFFLKDTTRFVVNSTLGLAGFFDIAEKMGTPRHTQDFGITLAKWGVKDTPYIIMPVFGSFTVSDLVGSAADQYLKPWVYIDPAKVGWGLYALDKIQIRASFLSTDHLVDEALDPYIFVRDAYLQSRQNDIDTALGKKGLEVSGAVNEEEDTFVPAIEEEKTKAEKTKTESKTKQSTKDTVKSESKKMKAPVKTPF